MRLISQLKNEYKSIHFLKDTFAGIMVALVSIPISMGYAQIAGLPVVYGLYGSLLPILVFGLLTTSPQFVVGVDAMPAVMVGSLLATMGIAGESGEAMSVVPVVSLLVAAWFVVFYFFKAGRIVKYISTPVMGGFISGVGTTIILMQIPKLFGGTAGTGNFISLIRHISDETKHFNLFSFCLGIGTIVIILLSKKLIAKVPMTVIMLVFGALAQIMFDLNQYGVKLLPAVDGGLPKPVLPDFSAINGYVSDVVIEAFSIALVIMAQTLLASGNYAMKYGDKLDTNAELIAYSGMNFVSGIFGCAPVNGSVSRSGIADSFGCRSQIMSVAASLSMLVILLFCTPALKYLPVPVLTAIVMTALIGILEIKLSYRLWKASKGEWTIFMLSFMAVLLFGTVNGVIVGCVLSFMEVAIRATNPPRTFVGRINGQGNFYALDRNSNAKAIRHVIIYRFSGNLFFANIDRFDKDIETAIKPDTKCVIIDARGIGTVDITAVDHLLVLADSLKKKNIQFYITEHDGALNDMIRKFGGESLIRNGQVRRTITLALRDAGFEKPYVLEDDVQSAPAVDEAYEKLAEMEWAFGEDASEWIEKLANEAADELILDDKNNDGRDLTLGDESHLRVRTRWGTLGRFDENAFWDFLEMRLEELHNAGKISDSSLDRLEKRIEHRRLETENRLFMLNPRALELLREHRKKLYRHFKEENPEEFEHIVSLQKTLFDELEKNNPNIAEEIKKLHNTHS